MRPPNSAAWWAPRWAPLAFSSHPGQAGNAACRRGWAGRAARWRRTWRPEAGEKSRAAWDCGARHGPGRLAPHPRRSPSPQGEQRAPASGQPHAVLTHLLRWRQLAQRLTTGPAPSLCPSPAQGAESQPKKLQRDWRKRAATGTTAHAQPRPTHRRCPVPAPLTAALRAGEGEGSGQPLSRGYWAAPRGAPGDKALAAPHSCRSVHEPVSCPVPLPRSGELLSCDRPEEGCDLLGSPGGKYWCTLSLLNPVPGLLSLPSYCPYLGAFQPVRRATAQGNVKPETLPHSCSNLVYVPAACF